MKKVVNSEALTSIFDYWPSFHDAEVIQVRLDRGGGVGSDGEPTLPSLEADIHVFEMTEEIATNGAYVLHKHTLATFAFRGIDELELKWFNHQNVLWELELEDISDRQLEALNWAVRFASSSGLEGSFKCGEIEVLRAVPFDPPEWLATPRQLAPRPAPGESR
jgi:hypothetical protein